MRDAERPVSIAAILYFTAPGLQFLGSVARPVLEPRGTCS
jgi:hypothetical protein